MAESPRSLYLALPRVFDAAECDAIIALAVRGGEAAPVYGHAGYSVDRSQRDVHTVLLPRSAQIEWIFAKLDAVFAQAAREFGLPVDAVSEPLQLLRYDVGHHFQAWHSDAGADAHAQRRISLSLELSERADYEGGELEIVPARVMCLRTLPRGSVQAFPSRALHRVTPVTRGTRWALVAWTGLNAQARASTDGEG